MDGTASPGKRRKAAKAVGPAVPAERGQAGVLAFLARMDGATLEGWAVDRAAPREKLKLRVMIDRVIIDVVTCNLPRNDAAALNLPSDRIGFYYVIPTSYQDGGRHVLTFADLSGQPVLIATRSGMTMPELHFCLARQSHVEGVMDGLVDGLVQGWALNIDHRTNAKTGGVRILVTTGGQPLAELVADQFRADVAEALGSEATCGFAYSPPGELRHGGRVMLSFYAMPERVELRGSPVEIVFPGDTERQRINALIARADELFRYAYHLRRELKAALPGDRYLLGDYARWAAKTLPHARDRAAARYGALPEAMPLVSIVCPVFKPAPGDFLMAVDSVRRQSYENWELILVDDGSKDDELSDLLKRLTRLDPRIKIAALRENGGISRATNKAVSMAKGVFVAFLDHDDLIEPDALDIMVRAQAATGARLLYSDEDKVERSGTLSEPHLKSDFNYRLLLELNYICHFVMCDLALIKEVGGFVPANDGAQDHDFLLRVVETIPAGEIHHVAEILYHWRKSSTSTAGAGSVKPEALIAGQRAVADHLKRRRMEAEIHSRGGLTCYRIAWNPPADRKREAGVSILIPFRDHIDLTRACVEAIRRHTRDVNYEIILLDNWSNSAAAEMFCVEQANIAKTSVIRLAEPFNYSRLNNVGARAARYDFLLLLNNDVFVSHPTWLRTMLNECLMDERVGGVGAKLLYPNGTVQHGGVVLGVGGIADHAFRGLAGDAPGYVMRAITTQQVSAVTAACMLVRKAAFDEVGGFDEAELTIAFNDVDLCIKLGNAGWRIIFAADVVAEHRESMSRGDDLNESKVARFMLENEAMRQRYADVLGHDAFYNPHFSREGGVYRELRRLDAEFAAPPGA
jgi:GT2 family glycosyltransferase